MKSEHSESTQARTGAPLWVKTAASLASVAMLLAISSYNVVPTIRRAADGEVAAIGLAAVQIAFTIILAVIPFVPGWTADTRKVLTLAFMVGNGYFAFEIAGHRHDGERTATNQHNAIVKELGEKQEALKALGNFKPADDYEVAYAENAAKVADADKAAARASVIDAKAKLAECERRCGALENEVKRLESEAKQKNADAKAAHDELKRLSGLRTLTKQAAPISARIDELQKQVDGEKFVSVTGSNTETGRTIEALLIALLIELGNRFGPEAIFKFIFFVAGFPLVLPLQFKGDAEEESAPLSSVALPAVPHVEVSEPAADGPAPLPPPSPRKRTTKCKPQATYSGPGAVVLPFTKRPTDGEVLTLLSSGKTQKQVAALLGIGERTVRRMVAASKTGQMAALARGQIAG
jgi:hypothetical protein